VATTILDLAPAGSGGTPTLPQTFTAGNYPLSTLNSGKFHLVWTPAAANTDAAW